MKKYKKFVLFTLPAIITLAIVGMAIQHVFDDSDFVEADVLKMDGDTIILGYGCKAIVADTSPERSLAIKRGMEGVIEYRPVTHDTFVQVLKSFDIELERVEMTRFDGDFYYSDLILNDGEKILRLDAMPSDGIALALRLNSTIYVNRTLLEDVGEEIC